MELECLVWSLSLGGGVMGRTGCIRLDEYVYDDTPPIIYIHIFI